MSQIGPEIEAIIERFKQHAPALHSEIEVAAKKVAEMAVEVAGSKEGISNLNSAQRFYLTKVCDAEAEKLEEKHRNNITDVTAEIERNHPVRTKFTTGQDLSQQASDKLTASGSGYAAYPVPGLFVDDAAPTNPANQPNTPANKAGDALTTAQDKLRSSSDNDFDDLVNRARNRLYAKMAMKPKSAPRPDKPY